jgi:hypothetical protein
MYIVPTSCALELCRLASADSEMRNASGVTQPNTAEAGSVGGTSVSGQESISPVKPNISSRPLAGSGAGKSYDPWVSLRVSLSF